MVLQDLLNGGWWGVVGGGRLIGWSVPSCVKRATHGEQRDGSRRLAPRRGRGETETAPRREGVLTCSMQNMPPFDAIKVWLCAFWHMLLSAPHADLRKSAVAGCIFMPRRMMGMPPCCPMTSFRSGLLKARDHSKSQAASSRSCRSTCCSITEQISRMPSRAISSLLASSRLRMASTPQQVFRLSMCRGLSIILCRISCTRFSGDSPPTIMSLGISPDRPGRHRRRRRLRRGRRSGEVEAGELETPATGSCQSKGRARQARERLKLIPVSSLDLDFLGTISMMEMK